LPAFLFTPTPTPRIYTLSLHDALPILWMQTMAVHDAASQGATMAIASATASGAGSDAEIGIQRVSMDLAAAGSVNGLTNLAATADRKSTRLNSSHVSISYAVFCLKKKK